ncbi:glycosyltransferase family 1 protein [Xylanibacillus composti]|uniref:Glycosyltransferase involved in cell wall biosynthesis n=1 Tax=Xylanibacillus composti TaxID=1572762 RepID=A0A8J4H4S0_9BACL|nr:glycosyltransferase family 1 protein [Xylanibacillus composti]MDT9723441.1 glycosyltransferase family 1 protein [Xylanibacillus composti]GIQ68523.1 hypothetical protein XYCOK13_13470 [Xylanibacillus composti]
MSKSFHVFHSPLEIAGQMGMLVGGLRKYGHMAVGYNMFINYLRYSNHIINTYLDNIKESYELIKAGYPIMHFHFGTTLDRNLYDLPTYAAEGKKMVMHHWGNDVRIAGLAKTFSPYLTDPCNPWSDAEMVQRLQYMSAYIPTAIIQDHELMPYVKPYYKHVFVLPLAFPVQTTVPVYPLRSNSVPMIVHAPTQPSFKGTAIIEAALQSLWSQGYSFTYYKIENMSHDQALQLYHQADIVIDQILVGTYGLFSVEAMALGKPVVCHIRDDLRSTYPGDLPIVSANPANLQEALVPLITDAAKREKLGKRGRKYAEEVHDISKVIPKLVDIYKVVENS